MRIVMIGHLLMMLHIVNRVKESKKRPGNLREFRKEGTLLGYFPEEICKTVSFFIRCGDRSYEYTHSHWYTSQLANTISLEYNVKK